MQNDYLTIALCKGNLLRSTLELLAAVGLPCEGVSEDTRNLVFTFADERVRYLMCRPTDVPTYVEQGAADLGIVGKDVIVEQQKDVFELVDLGFGACRFVVAVPEHMKNVRLKDLNYRRVATKFPRVAEEFFRNQGMQVEVIKLHGNIELAPLIGIADMIVDIVSSGRTLRENNLVELVHIMDSTSRLISNRVSFRTKFDRIEPLVQIMQEKAKKGESR
ncbi:ATP phosphoribosyltransferase [Capillibacterium thermochitinicola]|uniref:ATP phosphoribosyltransferase n=1 Tax=Capillibacterium thermochitinicola TaxID=2699427 RepID=A0A8J6I396_9FIRM|nr:ATP phosphoribosyltransferase [Capillibacterium thermochitinicola]MBA2134168.1 ATP phosphoribosyltransferase [Capillibacterium thermochitinicola]